MNRLAFLIITMALICIAGASAQSAEQNQTLEQQRQQLALDVMNDVPPGTLPLERFGSQGNIVAVQDPKSGEVRLYDLNAKTWYGDESYYPQDDEEMKKTMDQLRKDHGEYQRTTVLTDFVQYYSQYSGLAGWSALIFDEEDLKQWRETINTLMCDKLHLPTKECWVSKTCMKHADIKPTNNGVLFTSAFGAAPRGIAHVEGQRSLPLTLPNETKWGYTITFGLSNPGDDDMNYNIQFVSSQRTSYWWSTPQTLGKGNTVGYLGASALYKISSTDYNSVCLTFDPQITAADGKRVGRVCNSIVQYSGGATAPYPVPANETTTAGTTSPAGPSAPLPPGATV